MARHTLQIGPCYCSTGRVRYGIAPSIAIPWENPWSTPLPLPPPDLDSDSLSDVDANDGILKSHQGEKGEEGEKGEQVEQEGRGHEDNPDIPGAQGDEDDPDSNYDANDEADRDDADEDDQSNTTPEGNGSTTLGQPVFINVENFLLNLDGSTLNLGPLPLLPSFDWGPEIDPPPGFGVLQADELVIEVNDLPGLPASDSDSDANPEGNNPPGEPPQNTGDDGSGDRVPTIACYRLNLTALSQRYNIYAAAYGDVIHISRVRSCVDHTLLKHPDLVLRIPRSDEAAIVGGHMDHANGHDMNHLVMGDLGDEEILLVACDDGDVLAYYSSHIEKALLHSRFGNAFHRTAPVEPFFHENVGISAWGLAIHKKSRLIAVGNNNHEVHVFAMALVDTLRTSEELDEQRYEPPLFHTIRKPPGALALFDPEFPSADRITNIVASIRKRERGYRFVLETEGNNLPNIAFINDSNGDAIQVLAVDIGGKLWVLDIWSLSARTPWENQCYRFQRAPLWNVSDVYRDWYDSTRDHGGEWDARQDEAADKSLRLPLNPDKRIEAESIPGITGDGSSVIRTYEMDIELVGDNDNVGIMLEDAIYQTKPHGSLMPHVPFPPERLANLLHVPELSLVVAGSLCGRVLLITLTRPTNPYYSFKRGFRVEAILPRKKDEDRHLRPICPLLGVAVGPIPTARGKFPADGPNECRYRIMIHYYDHRILSYEVYRNPMTSSLSII
ncbi:hypothetical protein NUW58_g5515 [Xylaria curta]|uniref:Uncharacterized protein n=1 Tax=Xylaria curta TaxID=42375 RepID=A0ACC1P3W9_9PEZI|nr:hypothetical protein NUW58_g5515 [Xylaria curta]